MATEESTLQTIVDSYNSKLNTLNTNITDVVQKLNALNIYNIVGTIETFGDLTDYGINSAYVYNGSTTIYNEKTIYQGDIFIRTGADTFDIVSPTRGPTYYPTLDGTTLSYTYNTDHEKEVNVIHKLTLTNMSNATPLTITQVQSKSYDNLPILYIYYSSDGKIFEEVDLDYTITYANSVYKVTFTETSDKYKVVVRT